MLSLDLEEFIFELKDGAIKNVGAPNKAATAKLYDVETIGVDEFGDERVKLRFADAEGNRVEVALFPEQARAVADGLERLEAESGVFE